MKPTSFNISPSHRPLLLLTALGVIVLIYRMVTTQTIFFTFLLWNLFLAFLPFVISGLIRYNKKISSSNVISYILFGLWLVFLPNSPYIITDFIHLETGISTMWVDLFLLFVFALNGVLLGALSMIDMHYSITQRFNTNIARITLLVVCVLSGYGIFIGRFLRFNSWDIVARPKTLVYCLYKCLFLWEAWLWTIGFGCFMWVSFLILRPLLNQPDKTS